MGQEPRRITHKLIATNAHGVVLGSVIIDYCSDRVEAYCNDCERRYVQPGPIAAALDWIETHDHHVTVTRLAPISVERVPADWWGDSDVAVTVVDR